MFNLTRPAANARLLPGTWLHLLSISLNAYPILLFSAGCCCCQSHRPAQYFDCSKKRRRRSGVLPPCYPIYRVFTSPPIHVCLFHSTNPVSTHVETFLFFSSNTNRANLFCGPPRFSHGRPVQFNCAKIDPALHCSVSKGRLDICRLLLQCTANVGAKDNE